MDIKDAEGWRIIAGPGTTGSYVRVERPGDASLKKAMAPWRGWVTEISEDGQTVRIRDAKGALRAARVSECHVTRPTRHAKAVATMTKANSVKPKSLRRRTL
jgi:hypothetical protein